MSSAQKVHVSQVEAASPRLAALRIELCPDYMSEGRFWKIYFVLLHSRLSKTDAELLSTPQVKSMLLHTSFLSCVNLHCLLQFVFPILLPVHSRFVCPQ
jgi:hypothetical protein